MVTVECWGPSHMSLLFLLVLQGDIVCLLLKPKNNLFFYIYTTARYGTYSGQLVCFFLFLVLSFSFVVLDEKTFEEIQNKQVILEET